VDYNSNPNYVTFEDSLGYKFTGIPATKYSDELNKENKTGTFLIQENGEIYDFSTFPNSFGKYEVDKDGKWFAAKYGDYSEQYWKQIRSYLLEYKNDEVVELGCGLGVNLFRLSKDGFTKLQGYDLSENAIKFATQYNKKINGNLEFDVLDLTDKLPNFSNKIIFTHACLEQVKHSMKTVIQNIIDSKPELVINFEVDFDNAPFMVKQYCNAMDFQNNLIQELNKNKNVEIILIKRLSLNISHVNIMSAIIWRPIVEYS